MDEPEAAQVEPGAAQIEDIRSARGLTFSFVLPLLSLIVWIVMVASPATVTYLDLRQKATERVGTSEPMEANLLRSPWPEALSYVVDAATAENSRVIEALNLPGLAGELLSSVGSWPESWRPKGFMLDPWRCLSLPFFALPAWWFAGRGLDALLGLRRMSRVAFVAGTVLCLFFLFLCIGTWLSPEAAIEDGTGWVLWGLALWSALFATFPFAWLRGRQTQPAEETPVA